MLTQEEIDKVTPATTFPSLHHPFLYLLPRHFAAERVLLLLGTLPCVSDSHIVLSTRGSVVRPSKDLTRMDLERLTYGN